MSKEMKAGIALVTLLTTVFCGVLYQRVSKLKQTPAVAAKSDKADSSKKPAEKSGLFGSPNKLTAVEGGIAAGESPSARAGNSRWNSQASSDNDAKPSAIASEEASPPRASFMPAVDEPANDSTAPVAISNPFRRSAPVEEPAAAVEEPAATIEAAEAGPSQALIASDVASTPNSAVAETPPPVRIDEDAVAAAAVEPPRTSRYNINNRGDNAGDTSQEKPATEAAAPTTPENRYARPASRFITQDDEPVATAPLSSRAPMPSVRSTLPSQGRGGDTIASGKYTVGPNDNYWAISERAYGTGGYFKALHAYNKEKFPAQDELAVGDVIAVPAAIELERQFPSLCPKAGRKATTQQSYAVQASAKLRADGKTYVVQEGDTLFDIARYELGKASRWAEVYDLNREAIGDDLDFLRPGMELILPPEKCAGDSITRQPGSSLR